MNQSTHVTMDPTLGTQKNAWLWGLLLAGLALLVFIFRNGLTMLVEWWEKPEYSHGYMIPLVAAFLVWQRVNRLPAASERGSWAGVALLVIGLAAFIVGELSSLRSIVQYGFLSCFVGIILSFFGRGAVLLLWAAFVYLFFMIPLPDFLYSNLSGRLQMLSSQIGVAIIRLFQISVFLDGNVIDLGPMKLQVAEACSGLRYLFPLTSFGFLIAYLYRGPRWQQAILFLSTIPITILMNSIRIGLIGVTVDKWGIHMAEGFLHDFEGWVVFMGCLGFLFIEISIFHAFMKDGVGLMDRLNLDTPKLDIRLSDFRVDARHQRPFLVALAIMLVSLPFVGFIDERPEIVPERQSFDRFPMQHAGWSGRNLVLDGQTLDTLKLTDYKQIDFSNADGTHINFYVAWYASQKYGVGIHSPRACIPGGGWEITELEPHTVQSVTHVSGLPLTVNRALIQKNGVSQVVYYWFEGRKRDITDEYLAKWYLFWDALTQSRTDGALVRLVIYAGTPEEIAAADRTLEGFLKDFYPLLPTYTP